MAGFRVMVPCSTPVIQNGELVCDRRTRCLQFAEGPHNAFFVEVTLRIIISANGQNTGMASSRGSHQVVQLFKITGVVRDQYAAFEYGMREVHGIISACNSDVDWKALWPA